MGEAKRRGTFEERKAQAIVRNSDLARRTTEEIASRQSNRPGRGGLLTTLAVAAVMTQMANRRR